MPLIKRIHYWLIDWVYSGFQLGAAWIERPKTTRGKGVERGYWGAKFLILSLEMLHWKGVEWGGEIGAFLLQPTRGSEIVVSSQQGLGPNPGRKRISVLSERQRIASRWDVWGIGDHICRPFCWAWPLGARFGPLYIGLCPYTVLFSNKLSIPVSVLVYVFLSAPRKQKKNYTQLRSRNMCYSKPWNWKWSDSVRDVYSMAEWRTLRHWNFRGGGNCLKFCIM